MSIGQVQVWANQVLPGKNCSSELQHKQWKAASKSDEAATMEQITDAGCWNDHMQTCKTRAKLRDNKWRTSQMQKHIPKFASELQTSQHHKNHNTCPNLSKQTQTQTNVTQKFTQNAVLKSVIFPKVQVGPRVGPRHQLIGGRGPQAQAEPIPHRLLLLQWQLRQGPVQQLGAAVHLPMVAGAFKRSKKRRPMRPTIKS